MEGFGGAKPGCPAAADDTVPPGGPVVAAGPFTTRREVRGAYQSLFARGLVRKDVPGAGNGQSES